MCWQTLNVFREKLRDIEKPFERVFHKNSLVVSLKWLLPLGFAHPHPTSATSSHDTFGSGLVRSIKFFFARDAQLAGR